MSIDLTHEIELYPFESFKILLEHEVIRSRRYKSPLSLLHIAVEANSDDPHAQHSAEVFAINVLNLYLRETDIPCRDGNEFLVIMPATDEQGGRITCERLEKLFKVEPQQYDRVSFTFSTFIGLATSSDGSASSRKLLDQAEAALQYARSNHLTNAVNFSEIKS
jgi:GGDEF domain-containing protein